MAFPALGVGHFRRMCPRRHHLAEVCDVGRRPGRPGPVRRREDSASPPFLAGPLCASVGAAEGAGDSRGNRSLPRWSPFGVVRCFLLVSVGKSCRVSRILPFPGGHPTLHGMYRALRRAKLERLRDW